MKPIISEKSFLWRHDFRTLLEAKQFTYTAKTSMWYEEMYGGFIKRLKMHNNLKYF